MNAPDGNDPGIRSVLVVGAGASALLTALALDRAYRGTGLDVGLVDMPSATGPADVYTALPDLRRFHPRLGIKQADIFKHVDASFTLGQQYIGWSGADSAFINGHAETGRDLRDLPFLAYWLKASANGMKVPFEEFNAGSVAARNARMPDPNAKTPVDFGYTMDARGYETILRKTVAASGIAVYAEARPRAVVEGGLIGAIRLSDGRHLSADLYVDATGHSVDLLSMLEPENRIVGSYGSPCDRVLIANVPAFAPVPLHSRVTAHSAGWQGLYPLKTRTGVIVAYNSNHCSDDEAARRSGAGNKDIMIRPIVQDIMARPWIGNCVAVGEGACSLDPVDGLSLHRDQIAINHLVSLMPVDRTSMIEAAIYNEEVTVHYQRMLDYQCAHYRLNRRTGDAFWDAARTIPISEMLGYKLDLFGSRGMVVEYNQESFNIDSWQAMMVGHGHIPRTIDQQIDVIPEEEVVQHFQTLLRSMKTCLQTMVSHDEARALAAQAQ
jgi:tryptophan 7-halogenase